MHISTHITNEKKWRSYRRKIVNEGNSSMKGRTVSEIGCSAPICNFGVLTGEDAHPSIPPSWIQNILFIIGNWNMLKILQASLQEYLNQELPDAQAGFRKGRGTRNQIANISWIIEKSR